MEEQVVKAEITLRTDGVPPQDDLDVFLHALVGGRGEQQRTIARVCLKVLRKYLDEELPDPNSNGHSGLPSLSDWSRITGFYE